MSTAADRAGPPWQQIHRRTVLVTALVTTGVAVGAAVPVVAGLAGRLGYAAAVGWALAGAAVLVGCATAGDYVRLRRTRYRVGAEHVELRTGLLLVKRRSLARERIRSVDLTAHPLLRVLGLVTVRIGTGEQTGGESTLELDPVDRAEGSGCAANSWTASPPRPPAHTARATWPRSTSAGSATHRSPSSPPRSAARRSAVCCRSASGPGRRAR